MEKFIRRFEAVCKEVDEMKGRTLDEMSQVVGEINDKIKRRKHQLAPQIMKLRKLRTDVRDKETVYQEKKTAYMNAKAGIDTTLGDVQSEADTAAKEAAHEESQAAYYESCAFNLRLTVLSKLRELRGCVSGAQPAPIAHTSRRPLPTRMH